jgi:cell filamentation protein
MYGAEPDPYCYPGTDILANIPGLRDTAALEEFELAMVAQRASEPHPPGRLSARHYRAINHHLFQDVYGWAGRYRTVRLTKGRSTFCFPENIAPEMTRLFLALRRAQFLCRLSADAFAAQAAHFLAELNAIHPFREGNGRTQLSFLTLLAKRAGHPLLLARLDPGRFLAAMIESFGGSEEPLAGQIRNLITPR